MIELEVSRGRNAIGSRVAEATLYTEGSKDLLHAQRLEDRVYGIGIKARLELCK